MIVQVQSLPKMGPIRMPFPNVDPEWRMDERSEDCALRHRGGAAAVADRCLDGRHARWRGAGAPRVQQRDVDTWRTAGAEALNSVPLFFN